MIDYVFVVIGPRCTLRDLFQLMGAGVVSAAKPMK